MGAAKCARLSGDYQIKRCHGREGGDGIILIDYDSALKIKDDTIISFIL